MRMALLAPLLLLAAGAVGALVHATWVGGAATRDETSGAGETREAPATAAREPRFDALDRRMEAVETQLRLLREESDARWKQWSAAQETVPARWPEGGPPGSAETDVAPIDESPRAVEALRAKWRDVLADMDRRLDDRVREGAAPNEAVMWSYRDDVRRARAALEEAQDMKALRRLAEGEFKNSFRLER